MKTTKAVSKQENLKSLMQTQLMPEVQKALPPHISVDKFARVFQTAVIGDPKLMNANTSSLFSACVRAAQTGLLPDGKESALVPFGETITFMPMYQGLLKLIRNSGELASITAQCVYENDSFKVWTDEKGQHLHHEPDYFSDRGSFALVYAVAQTKDGATYLEIMDKKQVEQVRNVSKAKNGSAWKDWYDEMAKKSVIRRLAKRLPMSTDLELALKADDETYELEPQQVKTQTNETTPQKLEHLLTEKTEEAPPKEEPEVI